jgi:hypothetical protein
MKKFQIIGLSGLAGSGKDTVAAALKQYLGFEHLAFADALRSQVADAYRIDPLHLTQRATKDRTTPALALRQCRDKAFVATMRDAASDGAYGDFMDAPRSPRWTLQRWGTEYRRQADDSYWTRILANRIHTQQMAGHQLHVVSDVRFANEADCIRRMGGTIWQVTRPSLAQVEHHISETDGSAFSPTVALRNVGTLQDLGRAAIGAWLQEQTGVSAAEIVEAA